MSNNFSFSNSAYGATENRENFMDYNHSDISQSLPQHNHLTTPSTHQHENVARFQTAPSYDELYQNWKSSTDTSNRMSQLYQESLQENNLLRSKNVDLEAEVARLKTCQTSRLETHSRHQSTSSFADTADTHGTWSSRDTSPAVPASSSLPLADPSTTRPSRYPASILWFYEDCKNDPSIDTTHENPSRIGLQKIIRHTDGTKVSQATVRLIAQSAKPIVADLLKLVPPSLATKDIGKSYLRSTYPTEWVRACVELERLHPLVGLCAGHWKAEHVLAQVVSTRKAGGKKAAAARVNDNDQDTVHLGAQTTISEIDMLPTNPSVTATTNDPVPEKRKRASSEAQSSPLNPSSPTEPLALPPSKKVKTGASGISSNSQLPKKAKRMFSHITSGLGTGKRDDSGGSSHSDSASAECPQPPLPEIKALSSTSLIQVPATYEALVAEFQSEFKHIPGNVLKVLKEMHKDRSPQDSQPSQDVTTFIERIEAADPTGEDDEDKTNQSWGHYQFTAGKLTCSSVLVSWDAVGNVNTAFRLIAAAVKTAKVARQLCFSRSIAVLTGFTADSYIQEIIELLSKRWEERASTTAGVSPGMEVADGDDSDGDHGETQADAEGLQKLHVSELKAWITDHSIVTAGKKKTDLIAVILDSPGNIPTKDDVAQILAKRPHK